LSVAVVLVQAAMVIEAVAGVALAARQLSKSQLQGRRCK
jgi:hypothetical protein